MLMTTAALEAHSRAYHFDSMILFIFFNDFDFCFFCVGVVTVASAHIHLRCVVFLLEGYCPLPQTTRTVRTGVQNDWNSRVLH